MFLGTSRSRCISVLFFREKACNTWHNHVDVWAVSYYIGEIMVDFYKNLHFHFRGTERKCGNSSARIGSTRTPTRCPDGPQSSRTLSRTPSKTNLTTLTSHSSEDRGSSLCYRTHQQGKRSSASKGTPLCVWNVSHVQKSRWFKPTQDELVFVKRTPKVSIYSHTYCFT